MYGPIVAHGVDELSEAWTTSTHPNTHNHTTQDACVSLDKKGGRALEDGKRIRARGTP